MRRKTTKTNRPAGGRQTPIDRIGSAVFGAVVLIAAMFAEVPIASAQDPGNGEAVTIEDTQCIQERTPFALGCTANDIQVAGVATDEFGDPLLTILDDGCAFPGDMVTFTATFEVVTTAKRRHDIGIYFATDGDPNGDGAFTSGDGISGANKGCSVSTMPYGQEPDWLDLDMTNDDPEGLIQDTCGDIDKPGHNPLFPELTMTAVCVDFDNNGTLNLPNCTSWRQFGSNELCTSPTETFPGSPSKCRCDDGFEVPIDVPVVNLDVVKTADPVAVDEPEGFVTFTVDITNPSPFATVTLDSVVDDELSDGTTITDILSTCGDPVLSPGETTTCTFTRPVSGNAGDVITDTVDVSGTDSEGVMVTGSDTADVTILNVESSISLMKTVDKPEILEPGATVTYTYKVTNTSTVDTVFLDTLTDDRLLDLNGQGDCDVDPAVELAPDEVYSCSVTVNLSGNAGDTIPNIGTASALDDDGTRVQSSDNALVTVTDVPSMIELLKTVSPLCDLEGDVNGAGCVDEPGGDVTYTYKVTNTSAVDTVFIDTLSDDKLGILQDQGDCDVDPAVELLPGGTYSCSVTVVLTGNAGAMIPNKGTASGVDDDDQPVVAMDVAAVNVNNVDPKASVTKTVTKTIVTYVVEIANNSVSSDPLTLTHLDDDIYGNLLGPNAAIDKNTCALLGTTTVINSDDTISCSFDAVIDSQTGQACVTDIVTGQLDDDDGTGVAPDPMDSAEVGFGDNVCGE